jgi:hypothetical protein
MLKMKFCQDYFSHGQLAKQGDVGMVPLFMRREEPPLKIGEVAETNIRPGFR